MTAHLGHGARPLAGSDRKAWATAQARAALAGWQAELIEGDDGGLELICSRGPQLLRFRGLDEFEDQIAAQSTRHVSGGFA